MSKTSRPRSESAVFQHDPSIATLKKEWEPGCQPDQVYDTALPPWRRWVRRRLVKRLRTEAEWMATWQRRVRTIGRDKYFYWTAVFGTHTFFMTFLPMFFFFGDAARGRGLLYVVGMGIYVSCFAKDLACTPRPYSPPVTRLTMSTHHHEYGFPSSHSTNSVSIALFLGEWLFRSRNNLGIAAVISGWLFLFIYAFSVVGGRLYTGMHSTADIIGGSLMGAGCWLLWLLIGETSEAVVKSGTILVPAVSIPVTLALVHHHPEPVDDCPCFEDAIAILSVVLGSIMGHWSVGRVSEPWRPGLWENGASFGIAVGCARIVLGIGVIFAWRLLAKSVLLSVLPPIFRAISGIVNQDLPTRRFYKPATEYSKIPATSIHPVPSLLSMHASDSGSTSTTDTPVASAYSSSVNLALPGDLRRSRAHPVKVHKSEDRIETPKSKEKGRPRYDADVLTKVGVYVGIGYLATTTLPWYFGVLERWITSYQGQ